MTNFFRLESPDDKDFTEGVGIFTEGTQEYYLAIRYG